MARLKDLVEKLVIKNTKSVIEPLIPHRLKHKLTWLFQVNSLQEEHIQQSNSFKRLMYNVLGEY